MNLLLVRDLGNGSIQVSWQREGDLPRAYPQPLPLVDPLTPDDRKEQRWYLEEYLSFPFGAEQRMAGWGEDTGARSTRSGTKDAKGSRCSGAPIL